MLVAKDLNGKETALYLKDFCSERIKKYGFYSLKSGACKGCPYKYRGSNPLMSCMFSNVPRDWSIESINEVYQKQEEARLKNNTLKDSSRVWNISDSQLGYMKKGLFSLVKALKAKGLSGVFKIEDKNDNITLSGNNFSITLYSNNNYKSKKKGYEDIEYALINSLSSLLEELPFSVKRITFNTEGIHECRVRNSEITGELEIILV